MEINFSRAVFEAGNLNERQVWDKEAKIDEDKESMIGLYSLFGTKKQVIIFLEVKKRRFFDSQEKLFPG